MFYTTAYYFIEKLKNHFGVVLVYLGFGLVYRSCSIYYFTETGRELNTGLLGMPPFSLNCLIIIKHILLHFIMVFGMSHIKVK